ncbi:hypothetical protein [Bacillus nitratireducens]|uniref:Uncharacterized protein n=1 Tax=Bacillus nitratireducens TaxID=2026193 RepID=A0ABU6P8L5_9BACI|nr:hypothetical protein [Bacillus nitratireducens]EJS55056.1 hypothetical protein ICG_03318 [Bacillus cereus BAG1X1-3]EOO78222.1 hypothetical protein IC7_01499 [Bacillus cereus BAG1O-1]PEX43812.1 hypothetical protein CN464_21860 [Bacillus cereus]MDR4170008.1 hypothetical protein [Bacillus nitratireducens]MED4677647.1 hypothetical protein [Bacillus nitratireducens]
MTMTAGLVLVGSCFIVAELCQIFIRKRMYKKRRPYELQYVPVFVILFCMLFALQNAIHFSPLLNIFLKFGLLYSGVGIALICILFCIRYIHYQSYIFILNWLKKSDRSHLT